MAEWKGLNKTDAAPASCGMLLTCTAGRAAQSEAEGLAGELLAMAASMGSHLEHYTGGSLEMMSLGAGRINDKKVRRLPAVQRAVDDEARSYDIWRVGTNRW